MDRPALHPLASLSSVWVRDLACNHHLRSASRTHQFASFPMRLEPDFDLSPPEVSDPLWCVLLLLTTEAIVDDSNPSRWWETREWESKGIRDEKYSPEWYKAGHRGQIDRCSSSVLSRTPSLPSLPLLRPEAPLWLLRHFHGLFFVEMRDGPSHLFHLL